MKKCLLGLLLAGALPAAMVAADAAQFKLVPFGAMAKVGGYQPIRLALAPQAPPELKKAPDGLGAPLYGVLKLGAAEAPQSFLVLVDEPEGKDARVFVDANANGDLTDDPAVMWTKRAYNGAGGVVLSQYQGGFSVKAKLGDDVADLRLGAYRFDPKDPGRAALKTTLLYYADYAREGQVKLGEKTYRAMLHDIATSGDFRGKAGAQASGVRFLIDVNGNGRFESQGEIYDVGRPFNISGTTYELKGIAASGATLEVVKSAQMVAEVLPPPDLSPGKKIPSFQAKTTDGKDVNFPTTYKGKLVLLDFWATWCGPCIAELPNLTGAYEKYHSKGLEVLGISLDRENMAEKLAAFTKDKNMPWAQVYEGKFWEASIARKYGINAIPAAFLVDGDTGEILASGNELRGDRLAKAIEKALTGKKLL